MNGERRKKFVVELRLFYIGRDEGLPGKEKSSKVSFHFMLDATCISMPITQHNDEF